MRWIDVGWTAFIEDATDFSEFFREQMSVQLMHRFNEQVGKENAVLDIGFMLHVGMTEMNIHYSEGYHWVSADIIGPDSCAREVSIFWHSDSLNSFINLTQSDLITASNICFGFGTDFDTEAYQKYFEMPKLDMQRHQLIFDVEYDFSVYPDLSLAFFFKYQPDTTALRQICKFLTHYIQLGYVSELSPDDDHYTMIIDFQSIPFEDGKAALITALKELSTIPGLSIEMVRIN